MTFDQIPNDQIIERTKNALIANGLTAEIVNSGAEAKKRVLELIPQDAEVMTMSSKTLEEIDLVKDINDSGKYNSVRNSLNKLNRETDHLKMQKIGSAPEYAVGSVHAITQDGKVMIASNSGSQLPGYVYGSNKVIWIVSAKKIVDNLDEAFKRIYDYVLPLESERVKKAYGMPHSNVSKLLIINKETNPERIVLILVKEDLGF